jgi:hypothetical protein
MKNPPVSPNPRAPACSNSGPSRPPFQPAPKTLRPSAPSAPSAPSVLNSSSLQVFHRPTRGPACAEPFPAISVSICSKSQSTPSGVKNPRNPLIFPFFSRNQSIFNTSTRKSSTTHPPNAFRTIIRTLPRTINNRTKSLQIINHQPQACQNEKNALPNFRTIRTMFGPSKGIGSNRAPFRSPSPPAERVHSWPLLAADRLVNGHSSRDNNS